MLVSRRIRGDPAQQRMVIDSLVPTLAVYAVPVILAITLHEAAHGYVAKLCGDLTAYRMGRVSINPARHVDLVGTILVPIVTLLASVATKGAMVPFGWAKPVPVNYYALRRPKAHMLWVAAAGPGANLAQALVWLLAYKLAGGAGEGAMLLLRQVAEAGVTVNVALMMLNLIPILPLDGGRIAVSLLPDRLAASYARLEPFGFPILLALVFAHMQTGLFDPLMSGAGQAFGQLMRLGA
jgi:Zn-dependent protease